MVRATSIEKLLTMLDKPTIVWYIILMNENKVNFIEIAKLLGSLFAFTFGILSLVGAWAVVVSTNWGQYFESLAK